MQTPESLLLDTHALAWFPSDDEMIVQAVKKAPPYCDQTCTPYAFTLTRTNALARPQDRRQSWKPRPQGSHRRKEVIDAVVAPKGDARRGGKDAGAQYKTITATSAWVSSARISAACVSSRALISWVAQLPRRIQTTMGG